MPDMLKRYWPTVPIALLALLSLVGCTYTNANYGEASLTSFRFMTDTSASLTTPELDASYSSDADTAAAASMNKILLDALIGSRLVAPGP